MESFSKTHIIFTILQYIMYEKSFSISQYVFRFYDEFTLYSLPGHMFPCEIQNSLDGYTIYVSWDTCVPTS